jgi:hypothetical protein
MKLKMRFTVSAKMETSLQWSSIMLLSSNENQNIPVSYQSVKCGLCIFHITIITKKDFIFGC